MWNELFKFSVLYVADTEKEPFSRYISSYTVQSQGNFHAVELKIVVPNAKEAISVANFRS
jgi:hypothetical protein